MRDKIVALICKLKQCAVQNEKDGVGPAYDTDAANARGVAGEQRRMVKILMNLLAEENAPKLNATCIRPDGHGGPCNGLPRRQCITGTVLS